MRIAQIAPLAEAVPPKLYGGTERVVFWLTEELVEMGHEVTLFASGDSVTSANLEPISPKALRLDRNSPDPMLVYAAMLARVADLSDHFDVVHALSTGFTSHCCGLWAFPSLRPCTDGWIIPLWRRCAQTAFPTRISSRFPRRSVFRCRRQIGWARCTTVCRKIC